MPRHTHHQLLPKLNRLHCSATTPTVQPSLPYKVPVKQGIKARVSVCLVLISLTNSNRTPVSSAAYIPVQRSIASDPRTHRAKRVRLVLASSVFLNQRFLRKLLTRFFISVVSSESARSATSATAPIVVAA